MAIVPEDGALWRYGIISPLLHREEGGVPLYQHLKNLSRQPFLRPDGTTRYLSGETLRQWLYRYRKGGLEALADTRRCDNGLTHVPRPFQERLQKERKDHPEWTLKRIFLSLRAEGFWNGHAPSRSALYRFAKTARLGRNLATLTEAGRAFAFERFGELWMADFLHGPKIKKGRRHLKTYLLCILDDATRYVVSARFHAAEDTCALIGDLMEAVRRFGIPRRYYTDNGAAFKSKHLAFVGARLGLELPHTPAYVPRGRGKIERLFRSMRDGFLSGYEPLSMDALSRKLSEWIAVYHAQVHASLGVSPLEKRMALESVVRPLPDRADLYALFRMEDKKRVLKNGCVRMFGRLFEIKDAFPGETLPVAYLPWQKDRLFYRSGGAGPLRKAEPVDLAKNARRFEDTPFRGKGVA